jgi:hypothetical protein
MLYSASVNVEHYCGKQRTRAPRTIDRRNRRAMAAFKKDVGSLLQEKGYSAEAVQFQNGFSNIATVLLGCTAEIAELLSRLAGVSSFMQIQ